MSERVHAPSDDDARDGVGSSERFKHSHSPPKTSKQEYAHRRQKRTPAEEQALKLEKLLANSEKPIVLPSAPREKTIRAPREMMKNVSGSSAGAGSGEFHIYKHSRRREFERVKLMEEADKRKREQEAFEQRQAALDRESEAKSRKNRAKRDKKKAAREAARMASKREKGEQSSFSMQGSQATSLFQGDQSDGDRGQSESEEGRDVKRQRVDAQGADDDL